MKFRTKIFFSCLCIFLLSSIPSYINAESRVWTGINGKRLIAEFVEVSADDTIVTLKTPDGKYIETKFENLIYSDREYINKLLSNKSITSYKPKMVSPQMFFIGEKEIYIPAPDGFFFVQEDEINIVQTDDAVNENLATLFIDSSIFDAKSGKYSHP
jgi:hypothetical protein